MITRGDIGIGYIHVIDVNLLVKSLGASQDFFPFKFLKMLLVSDTTTQKAFSMVLQVHTGIKSTCPVAQGK